MSIEFRLIIDLDVDQVPIEMPSEGIYRHSTGDAINPHLSCLLFFFLILECTENVTKSFGRLDVTYTSKFDPHCNWILSPTGMTQAVAIFSINQIYFASSRYAVSVAIKVIPLKLFYYQTFF